MTDRCTLGPQGVGTWPGRARGRRAYKSSRRSSARRPCGGGPPFHPRARGAGIFWMPWPAVTRGLRSGVFVTSLLVFSERYGDLERQPVSSLRA